jgi:GNAT superfamily N-acetyltransferase
MQIRLFEAEDAPVLQPLRLRSLREHPEAFGSSYEDECQLPLETVANYLRPTPDSWMLGAWVDMQLMGMLSFRRNPGRKVRHRGGLGAMYVAPEYRGQGIGAALLAEAIRRAHTILDLEELTLAVTVSNQVAKSLYLRAGFVPSHVEKRYIKIDHHYFDIEWMTMRLVS